MLPAPPNSTSAVDSVRKASSAQLEAERNALLALIQTNSERVSFAVCVAGRAPVWTLFRKVLLDNQVTPFVVCQVCGKLLKYTSRDGTKSMKLHMSKCTPSIDQTGAEPNQVLSVTPATGSDGRSSSCCGASSWESTSITPNRALAGPSYASPPHLSINEDSTLDLSLHHSPSMAFTALTPAPSHISDPMGIGALDQTALQTVAKALQSALQVFDGNVNDVETEIANLENKLITLNSRRNELIRRKETVKRAAAALMIGSHPVQSASSLYEGSNSSVEPPEDPEYDCVPRKSRRKQSAHEVRHVSPNTLAAKNELTLNDHDENSTS